MRRPLIGVTGFHERWVFSSGAHRFTGVERVFTDGVVSGGGIPMILVNDASTVEEVLDLVDGLLLTGGSDVEPSQYQATPAPETGPPDRDRDAFEIALAQGAVRRSIPLLAVCRGNQVLNVALGGTLLQHVPGHEVDDQADRGVHGLDIVEGSQLHALLGAGTPQVNSLHHQAVASPASCLSVVARAPDGTVEATEHPELPVVGVQWHPERQADSPAWAILTSWLVEQARATQPQ